MNFFRWLIGSFTVRGKAMARCRRGMARAKKRDRQGAIEDYTSTLGMTGIPADVKAVALYNRALAHVAAGDDQKGVDDLDALLAMKEVLVNVKTMAREKLMRMERRAADGKQPSRRA